MSSDHLRLVSEPDSDYGSEPDSEVASNERTNGRTNEADSYGCRSGNGSRRERAYRDPSAGEPVSIAEAAGEWLDQIEDVALGQRWHVVRTGEREPIPAHVRAAVWYRDRGKCAECLPEYPRSEILHLDHIKPWSAGGADTTDNLRMLCEQHNLERSNFFDFARPMRPATWWCANCYTLDKHVWGYAGPFVTCPRHGSDDRLKDSRCRVARAYGRAWIATSEVPTWHQRPLLTAFDQIAYCAHCNAPGMTGVVL